MSCRDRLIHIANTGAGGVTDKLGRARGVEDIIGRTPFSRARGTIYEQLRRNGRNFGMNGHASSLKACERVVIRRGFACNIHLIIPIMDTKLSLFLAFC
ncbi:MAG: hypothetical protein ACJA0F_002506 [Dinoroseobacter sp.]|jgi:hypothetical protein